MDYYGQYHFIAVVVIKIYLHSTCNVFSQILIKKHEKLPQQKRNDDNKKVDCEYVMLVLHFNQRLNNNLGG